MMPMPMQINGIVNAPPDDEGTRGDGAVCGSTVPLTSAGPSSYTATSGVTESHGVGSPASAANGGADDAAACVNGDESGGENAGSAS